LIGRTLPQPEHATADSCCHVANAVEELDTLYIMQLQIAAPGE